MTAMFQGKPLFGPQGEPGATFTPSVSAEGELSWTNDKGLPNPEPVNVKGPQGAQGPTGSVGPKGEDFLNVYSTAETRIGTWIDGKPLYRKIIYLGDLTIPGVAEEAKGVLVITLDEIKDVDIVTKLEYATHGYGKDRYLGFSVAVAYSITYNEFTIKQTVSSASYKLYSFSIIFEYTKTTDAAPASQTNLLTSEVNSPETLSVESVASYAFASASSTKLDL